MLHDHVTGRSVAIAEAEAEGELDRLAEDWLGAKPEAGSNEVFASGAIVEDPPDDYLDACRSALEHIAAGGRVSGKPRAELAHADGRRRLDSRAVSAPACRQPRRIRGRRSASRSGHTFQLAGAPGARARQAGRHATDCRHAPARAARAMRR
jgi:hypothetical protein